jgi:hypothetical protein
MMLMLKLAICAISYQIGKKLAFRHFLAWGNECDTHNIKTKISCALGVSRNAIAILGEDGSFAGRKSIPQTASKIHTPICLPYA